MTWFKNLGTGLLCLLSLSAQSEVREMQLDKTKDGHYSLNVSVNGQQARFVLDTGATGTVIDSHVLDTLGIEKAHRTIDGIGSGDKSSGAIKSHLVKIDSLLIHGQETGLTQAFSHDVKAQLGKDISGLIGQDVLVKTGALVDLAQGKLLFTGNGEHKLVYVKDLKSNGYSELPVHSHSMGFHFINLKLAHRNVRLILDSGAPQVVLDKGSVEALGLKTKPHPTARSIDKDGNSHPMQVLTDRQLHLNQSKLHRDFMVSDLSGLMSVLNEKQGVPFVGVIGIKELSALHAILDLAGSSLYIRE